jgi:predicted enzyme related to lactoylglutathione lyase
MPRVVHFEIPADNTARAAKFYTSVFGWKVEKWAGPIEYWLATTGDPKEPGIDGAIMPRGGWSGIVNALGVPSVDEYIRKIKAAGGTIIQPKTAVPGTGWVAYFKDTEGNPGSIYQDDKSAK